MLLKARERLGSGQWADGRERFIGSGQWDNGRER